MLQNYYLYAFEQSDRARKCTDSHGPARTCTDSYGLHGLARTRTDLHGPARTRTDPHGLARTCTDAHRSMHRPTQHTIRNIYNVRNLPPKSAS